MTMGDLNAAMARDAAEYKTPAASQVETLALFGGQSWHRLETEVDHVMTAEEAMTIAGLDWEVALEPICLANFKGQVIPDKWAVVRKTDGKVYEVVGSFYTPIQNRECFEFFDAVVGTGEAKYHAAGSLKGGKRICLQAKLNDSLYPLGMEDERIDQYLMLVNSHDGQTARQMFFTPIRWVCWNTLRASLNNKLGETFYSRHTKNANGSDKVEQARQVLALVRLYYDKHKEMLEWLATCQLPPKNMDDFLLATFGQKAGIKMEDVYDPIQRQMERVKELVYVGRGNQNPKIQGTMYQAYMGATEFADHERKLHESTEREDAILFGSSAKLKERSLDWLLRASKY